MTTVAVLRSRKLRGREQIPPYIIEGIRAAGDDVIDLHNETYRKPCSDVVIFYGFDGSRDSVLARAYDDYTEQGRKAIYIDIGYFLAPREKLKSRYDNYMRFSINGRHPTAYFQRVKHPPDRFKQHRIKIEAWRKPGAHILVCGMSDKCARFEGYEFEEWERNAMAKLRQHTDRPIRYRPKPQRRKYSPYPPIKGYDYSDPRLPFSSELANAYAVVSHHSNCGIHAILAGIPCFQEEGVASVMGHSDMALI